MGLKFQLMDTINIIERESGEMKAPSLKQLCCLSIENLLFWYQLPRFVPGIFQDEPRLFDWTTYLVDRDFAVYKGQVPSGVGFNHFETIPANSIFLTKRASFFFNWMSNVDSWQNMPPDFACFVLASNNFCLQVLTTSSLNLGLVLNYTRNLRIHNNVWPFGIWALHEIA